MCCHDHGHREWHHHGHPHGDWGPRDHGWHGHRDPHHHHCGPDCFREWQDRGFGFRRRFVSNRELLDALKKYLKELENEAEGVREAIAEIEAEMEEGTEGAK